MSETSDDGAGKRSAISAGAESRESRVCPRSRAGRMCGEGGGKGGRGKDHGWRGAMHATLGTLDKYSAVTQSHWMFYLRGEDIPKTFGRMMAVEAGREVAWRARLGAGSQEFI